MDVHRYNFAVADNCIGTDSVRPTTATSFINSAVGFIIQTASLPSAIAVAVTNILELAIASSGVRYPLPSISPLL